MSRISRAADDCRRRGIRRGARRGGSARGWPEDGRRARGPDGHGLAGLLRLLRVLTMLEVFAEDEQGRFSNTKDSSLLLSATHSVRHFCMLAGGMYQRAFGDSGHALKTGEPAPWKTFGGSIYQFMEREPAQADIYDRAMEDLARATGPAWRRPAISAACAP